MINTQKQDELEARLNNFERSVRSDALRSLLDMAQSQDLFLPPVKDVVNMHCHTFFSFNAYGHSPTSLVWLAKKIGISLLGIVDFDVLDGVDEFLSACEVAGLRGTAGIETRAYIPEFASREINSPGEPGICYHMGIGFCSSQPAISGTQILSDLKIRADKRNRQQIKQINNELDPITIDFDQDVLPLTPAGSPTERHIVQAYIQAAQQKFSDPSTFWAKILNLSKPDATLLIQNPAKHQNTVRTRLMKKGGPGYMLPSRDTFPEIDEVNQFIVSSGALPTFAWLDGTSDGEQAIEELIGLMMLKGVVAINIIPDRNWNIPDPDQRKLKVAKLHEFIRLAIENDLIINVGTEMNSFGQKEVDDFSTPELADFQQVFREGAMCVYGHTMMHRQKMMGYQSLWANHFLHSRKEKNQFFASLGRLVQPTSIGLQRLSSLASDTTPEDVLQSLKEEIN